jgi:hypothetical protein
MKLRRWIVGPEVWKERSSFEILGSDFPVAKGHTRDEATLLSLYIDTIVQWTTMKFFT